MSSGFKCKVLCIIPSEGNLSSRYVLFNLNLYCLIFLVNCLAKSDRVSSYLKWVRLVRVRKKIKTQTRNPPRETTTRRGEGGGGGGGWQSDFRVIP